MFLRTSDKSINLDHISHVDWKLDAEGNPVGATTHGGAGSLKLKGDDAQILHDVLHAPEFDDSEEECDESEESEEGEGDESAEEGDEAGDEAGPAAEPADEAAAEPEAEQPAEEPAPAEDVLPMKPKRGRKGS